MKKTLALWWGSRRFRFERDLYCGQTKGCAVAIQVRYSRFLWFPQWAQERDAALVHIRLFAPVQSRGSGNGWYCVGFRFKVAR